MRENTPHLHVQCPILFYPMRITAPITDRKEQLINGEKKKNSIQNDTELFFKVNSSKKESSKSESQSSSPKNKQLCDNSNML